jgi:hypothetical protein
MDKRGACLDLRWQPGDVHDFGRLLMRTLRFFLGFMLLGSVAAATPIATLGSTGESLSVVTTSSAAVDYVVSWSDITTTSYTAGTSQGTISSATTTTIVAAPAASTQRVVMMVSFRDTDASNPNTLTTEKIVSAVVTTLRADTLAAGEAIFGTEDGWKHYNSSGVMVQVQNQTTIMTAALGGTGLNTSASTGYPSISSGVWSVASAVNTLIALGGVPTTTQVIAGSGLTGGGALSGNVTLAMPATGTASTYGYPTSLTTDVYGRVTSVTAGTASPQLTTVTVTFATSGGNATSSYATATVTGLSWVTTASQIQCHPQYVSAINGAYNTAEVAALEQFSPVVTSLVASTGFSLYVYTPVGAAGSFAFICTGA